MGLCEYVTCPLTPNVSGFAGRVRGAVPGAGETDLPDCRGATVVLGDRK